MYEFLPFKFLTLLLYSVMHVFQIFQICCNVRGETRAQIGLPAGSCTINSHTHPCNVALLLLLLLIFSFWGFLGNLQTSVSGTFWLLSDQQCSLKQLKLIHLLWSRRVACQAKAVHSLNSISKATFSIKSAPNAHCQVSGCEIHQKYVGTSIICPLSCQTCCMPLPGPGGAQADQLIHRKYFSCRKVLAKH